MPNNVVLRMSILQTERLSLRRFREEDVDTMANVPSRRAEKNGMAFETENSL
jgi:hypothetical protein